MVSLSYLGKPLLKYRLRISKAIVTLLLTYLGRTAIFVQQKLYTLPQWNRQICRWSIPTILATIIMTGLLTDGLYNRYGAILNNPPVAWCVRQSLDQTNLYFFFVPFTRRASVAPNAIRMLLLIHPLWFI